MPVEQQWYQPNTIYLATFSGHVTAAEHNAVNLSFIDQLNAVDHPIHVIVDWHGVTQQAHLSETLRTVIRLINHKNLGIVAIVGVSSHLKIWINVLSRATNFQCKTFNSVENAAQFLVDSGSDRRPN